MSDPNVSQALICDAIEQAESFMDEAAELSERKKDWKKEVKAQGLDASLIEAVAKERRADPDKLDERAAMMDLYKNAAGMA